MTDTAPHKRKALQTPADLALLGAPPLFAVPRHVNRPHVPDKAAFDARINAAWERRWFTNDGPLVKELEQRLCDYLDVPHCVLMSNATAALDLTMKALGVKGEVILPAYTFISTANILHIAGLTPVFCDVDASMALDPAACAARIGPRTGAVVATHVWGSPCDIDALQEVCDAHDIPLLFDAAHAFGARHKAHRLGRFGRAEVFSLHATKAFHTCEGGLVTTCDSTLAKTLRRMRNFGFDPMGAVACAGVNAKMSEMHAAMGLGNLDQIDATRVLAQDVHRAYARGLADLPGFILKLPPAAEENNHHYVVGRINAAEFGMDRDRLHAVLVAENVLARRYFRPGGHRCPPYIAQTKAAGLELPQTDALCNDVLVLPGGAAADPADVALICALIRFAHDNAAAIAPPQG